MPLDSTLAIDAAVYGLKKLENTLNTQQALVVVISRRIIKARVESNYSTVTDLARLRG